MMVANHGDPAHLLGIRFDLCIIIVRSIYPIDDTFCQSTIRPAPQVDNLADRGRRADVLSGEIQKTFFLKQ